VAGAEFTCLFMRELAFLNTFVKLSATSHLRDLD